MKFHVGQKVVPVSKSVWGQLEESNVWKEAQGQGFMFINGFEHEENAYICGSDHEEDCGDFFLESDLAPYIEAEPCDCCCNPGDLEIPTKSLEELQQEAIVELEDKVLELEDKIVELEDKMGAGKYKFQEVLHELKETKEDCVELEQRNKQLREQRDRYCEELKKNDQELTILDGKVYDMRIDLENAHGLIEKLKEELKEANLDLGRVGAERDRFRRDYDKERAKVFHMKKAMKEFIEVVEY
jgi:hypothetical protein